MWKKWYKKKRIIIDPGIGFGKKNKHNVQILQNLKIFKKLGCYTLIGLSRKRFISELTKNEKPINRIAGTIAANQFALDQGIDIIRVHDVDENYQMLSVISRILQRNFDVFWLHSNSRIEIQNTVDQPRTAASRYRSLSAGDGSPSSPRRSGSDLRNHG